MSCIQLSVPHVRTANRSVSSLLCGTALLLLGTTSGMAQSAVSSATDAQSTHELEDIVVTARRNAESLQRVPVSVVAISKDKLQNNDATDLSKLAELVPQVMIGTYGTGTGAILTIRGISTNPIDAGLDQSVLVVADGVPMSNGSVVTATQFDMQQVEVMEGPQALFFGKNAPAGVISLHSADPTDDLEGYLKAGYEFQAAERYAEGAISGPLTDDLTGRFAFRVDDKDGWIKNVAKPVADPLDPTVTFPGATMGSHLPAGHDYAGRVSLKWAPTPDFDAALKVTVDDQRINGNTAYFEIFCTGGATEPVELGIPEVGSDCKKNRVVNVSSEAPQFAVDFPYGNGGVPYQTSKFVLGSLIMNKRFDDITLTSTTGYYDQTHSGFASDFGPYSLINSSDHRTYKMETEELRASSEFSGPVNFMAGAYYEHSDRGWFNAANLLNAALNPVSNNYATSEMNASGGDDYYSAFGQIRWNIIPTLELAGGARYSHDKRDTTLENLANNPDAAGLGLDLYPQDTPLPITSSSNNVSPEVTLTWHPQEDQTLYGAYKQGFKAGGISNPALLYAYNNAQNLSFGPEKTNGYEVGYKADLADHRLRLDLTAYTYKYDSLQVAIVNAQFFSFQLANAGTARTKGVEGTIEWLATDQLTFNGNFGYNDAKYIKYPGAQCYAGQTAAQGCDPVANVQDLSGQPLNRAPKLTFDIGAEYAARFLTGWTADMTVDGAYSSSYQTASDYAPGGMQPAFWRLNAAVHLVPDSGHFEFAVIGRNLTNTYYMVTADNASLRASNDYLGVFNRPREVILQAQYNL
jgi:outer membrane receptor protein involved in Fe transport